MSRHIINGVLLLVVIGLIISLHTSFIANYDQKIGAFFQSIKQQQVLLILEGVGTLGSTIGIVIGLLVSMVILFIIYKNPLPPVILLLGVFFGNTLNKLLKEVTEKERPIVDGHFYEGYSFPSGHVMVGTVLYGLIIYFLILKVRSQATRQMMKALLVLILAIVGVSRLVEGAHYTTDVIGGFMCGLILLNSMQFFYEISYEKWLARRSKRNVSL